MNLSTFASRQAFRAWLTKNHRTTTELLVRCYKVKAKEKGLTYPEGVDEALCFGWIDGVGRSVNQERRGKDTSSTTWKWVACWFLPGVR